MLGDREARKPHEWDIRTGVILRKAHKHALPAPVSEVIVPLLAPAQRRPRLAHGTRVDPIALPL